MTYPHERQIEYWVSRAIEEYFTNNHYFVVALPNSQIIEKYIPFDHLFAERQIKMFGFQYKRFYTDRMEDDWHLCHDQHLKLQEFNWIYYALSEVRSIQQHRNALHLVRIVKPIIILHCSTPSRLKMSQFRSSSGFSYARWGDFVNRLFQCHFGMIIHSPSEIRNIFGKISQITNILIDMFRRIWTKSDLDLTKPFRSGNSLGTS